MTAEIYKKVIIENSDVDHVKSGLLTIKSSETLKVDSIRATIYFEARGRMSGQKDSVLSFNIPNQSILLKNETYKIPFSITLKDSLPDSYQGKNVSFTYTCEIKININEEDLSKVEKSIFNKIKSFVTADHSIKTSNSFQIYSTKRNYQVVERTASFKLKTNIVLSSLVAIIYGTTYAFLIPEFSSFYIFIGFASIAILIYLATILIENYLGTISMEPKIEEGNVFHCQIHRPNKMNLSHQNLYYEIIEQVVDRRGTSTQRLSKSIYRSSEKKLSDHKEISSFTFPYPDRTGLHSYEYNDTTILWQMNLEGKYFGLTLKYKCIFTVRRV